MDDRTDKLAAQYKDRIERENRNTAAFATRQKLLESQAAKLWQELRQEIKNLCDAINEAVGDETALVWGEPLEQRFTVTRKLDKTSLFGSYDEKLYQAEITSDKVSFRRALRICVQDDRVKFDGANDLLGGPEQGPKEIAFEVIQDFLSL